MKTKFSIKYYVCYSHKQNSDQHTTRSFCPTNNLPASSCFDNGTSKMVFIEYLRKKITVFLVYTSLLWKSLSYHPSVSSTFTASLLWFLVYASNNVPLSISWSEWMLDMQRIIIEEGGISPSKNFLDDRPVAMIHFSFISIHQILELVL